MNTVKIIINYPGHKAVKKELNINGYFEIEERLIDHIANKRGRLRVFLDGWHEIKVYPEKISPVENDRILSVILDKGDEKRSFELYESEFEIISEVWKERRWGYSAIDFAGNTVELVEYDYIYRLQENGKVYSGSRRVYSIEHEKNTKNSKIFFAEIVECIKKDCNRVFSFFMKRYNDPSRSLQ